MPRKHILTLSCPIGCLCVQEVVTELTQSIETMAIKDYWYDTVSGPSLKLIFKHASDGIAWALTCDIDGMTKKALGDQRWCQSKPGRCRLQPVSS